MSKVVKMRKRLLAALEEFKGSNGDLLHIVAEHLDLEEPVVAPIIDNLANLLDNEN